ncbi:hypothetical protein [Type-E symbiont of Plautia stali]|uniref:hypothetical protein n=1 Tax=Type-E symbiont of Plautia stali TaxID=1560357 RepID=UPI00128EEE5F|nr:hypothetical protein [Type-E symbiont of Plautia stali]
MNTFDILPDEEQQQTYRTSDTADELGTPQKSDQLKAREREANGKALIAQLNPTPVSSTGVYRSEWDDITGRLKQVPINQLETVDDLADRFQQEAEAFNQSQRDQRENEKDGKKQDFDSLFPSEQRLAIERYYTPLIRKLSSEHVECCDRVTEFEADELRYRSLIENNWAFEGKHPDVKILYSAGAQHFKHMLESGAFNVDGYKLAAQRTTTGGASRVFLIPKNVPNLMSYADASEAKALSQTEYQRDLERLITKRKQAAVKLTDTKKAARDALASIPSFEELISDSVKRALRK